MSLAASRAALRQSTFAVRRAGLRNASTTTEQATQAAKEKASQAKSEAQSKAAEFQSKASEGLTRVTSSAGSALSKAGDVASSTINTMANAGGRTGALMGRIQAMIPTTVYYSKVALEVSKYVVRERKMSPPDVATFQSYFQSMFGRIRSGEMLQQASKQAESAAGQVIAQPTSVISRMSNISTQQMASVGVVAAEILGFFTLGEMIGKWKIVGYRSSAPAHH